MRDWERDRVEREGKKLIGGAHIFFNHRGLSRGVGVISPVYIVGDE